MTSPNQSGNQAPKPPLSRGALDFLGEIMTTTHRSQLGTRTTGPALMRAVGEKRIRPDEVPLLNDAILAQREKLTAQPGEPPADPPEFLIPQPEAEWSPSGMIDETAGDRELDARERQLPRGDRD